MTTPLVSNYSASTKTKDDAVSLASGITVISTTLAATLNIGAAETTLTNAAGAPGRGVFVVENEVVYYGSRLGNTPATVEDLLRGRDGTTEVDHASGAAVTIVSAPRFGNPAFKDSVIAMQTQLGMIAEDASNVIATRCFAGR